MNVKAASVVPMSNQNITLYTLKQVRKQLKYMRGLVVTELNKMRLKRLQTHIGLYEECERQLEGKLKESGGHMVELSS